VVGVVLADSPSQAGHGSGLVPLTSPMTFYSFYSTHLQTRLSVAELASTAPALAILVVEHTILRLRSY